jgi:hypothetical protein
MNFSEALIAPCGMNCGTCIAFLRTKNRCPGCRVQWDDQSKSRLACRIKNCPHLAEAESKFCYDCPGFPCRRLKQLDRRYRTKYRTGFIENLLMIRDGGMENFLTFESARRRCPGCGSVVSVHRDHCPACNLEVAGPGMKTENTGIKSKNHENGKQA